MGVPGFKGGNCGRQASTRARWWPRWNRWASEVYYFENTKGGHDSGTTPEQRAKMSVVTYAYLWER